MFFKKVLGVHLTRLFIPISSLPFLSPPLLLSFLCQIYSITDLVNSSSPIQQPPSSCSPPSNSSRGPSPPQNEEGDDNWLPDVAISTNKRPREDLSQFAEQASRNVRLKTKAESEVKRFANLSSPEQRVMLFASLGSVHEKLEAVRAPDATYQIPAALNGRIERYVLGVLLSPSLSAFVTKSAPMKLIMDHLDKNPHLGVTADIKADVTKFSIVAARVRKRLTQRRAEIKGIIKESMGTVNDAGGREGTLDIVELCEALIGLREQGQFMRISLPMAARIAYLRALLSEKEEDGDASENFWKQVDAGLVEVREKKKTEERISRFFATILENDRHTYGKADLDGLVSNATAIFGQDDG